MNKSLLTLSILSLTLLAGCAKSEAQGDFIKVKKCVNESYIVKSWDSCDFINVNAKKYNNENVKSNFTLLSFTFTTMNGQEMPSYATVNSDGVTWGTANNLLEAEGYLKAKTEYTTYSLIDADGVTKGTLIKAKA